VSDASWKLGVRATAAMPNRVKNTNDSVWNNRNQKYCAQEKGLRALPPHTENYADHNRRQLSLLQIQVECMCLTTNLPWRQSILASSVSNHCGQSVERISKTSVHSSTDGHMHELDRCRPTISTALRSAGGRIRRRTMA